MESKELEAKIRALRTKRGKNANFNKWAAFHIDDLMALVTAEVERAMPTWWITTAPTATLHKKVLGPFHTQEIALNVRNYLEKAMFPTTYWVDQEKLQPQKDKS